MRILTTTLCYPMPEHPDQGVFIQRRALALADPPGPGNTRSRSDVSVVVPMPWCPVLRRGERVSEQPTPLRAAYPRMFSLPMVNWATDSLFYARALERSIKAMRGGEGADVDLIDAHFVYPDGVGAWLAGRRLGIPVAVTVRGKIVSLSRRTIRRMQIRAMLRGVAARIAVSDSLAAWVHQVAGSDLHVDVVPNGIDSSVYHLVERDRARRTLGWDPHTRYLLAVGHLQKLKGFDRMVSVMPAVRAAMGDVRLMLVGSRRGERRFQRKLRRMVDRCNATDGTELHQSCVQIAGPVGGDRLNLMYNAADLLINASRSEGWNNAISESLATGTPVVATDVGGNREQVCSTELGTIVPDDPGRLQLGTADNPLVGAIVTALSREWNRPLISAHGSARTWSHVADEVHAVFVRVLAARGRESHTRQPTSLSGLPASRTATPAIEVHR